MRAVATTPADVQGASFVLFPWNWQPSPYKRRVGFRIWLFEACSAFIAHYNPHTRGVTFLTLSIEGSGRFVTSTTAPIATGWNESCRVGLAPTE
jgi:hypothetical protein